MSSQVICRTAEMLGNFILPGLGTGLFSGRAGTGWWKPTLLAAMGLALSLGGASLVISLTGLVLTEDHLKKVFVGQPSNFWLLALGALLAFVGGLLVLGSYFWSVRSTVARWNEERR